jgi:hypothetical protein
MGGSIVCAKSLAEEGTETIGSNGNTVSSSSLRLALVGETSDPIGVTLEGLPLEPEGFQAISQFDVEDWKRAFAVYVVPADKALTSSIPPMSGRYSVDDDRLRFEPLFGFEKGVEYLAEFKASVLSLRLNRRGVSAGYGSQVDDVQLRFRSKLNRGEPSTALVAVYPSVSSLPENLLKFYLHFSQPMTWGTFYQYIHLERKDGTEIVAPFLQLDEELWDPSGKRMTILIDPGRIKSGLLPRDEVGPALESGNEFRLLVDSKWPDAEGLPLVEGFVKSFRVIDPDVLRPTMSTWRLDLPAANTKEPFDLTFPEPLDHALLQRVVWVADQDGMEIEGEVKIDLGETRWRFFPSMAWREEIYQLCAENSLEDLAGNSLGRLFEVDSFLTVSRRVERETVKRAFQIKALP